MLPGVVGGFAARTGVGALHHPAASSEVSSQKDVGGWSDGPKPEDGSWIARVSAALNLQNGDSEGDNGLARSRSAWTLELGNQRPGRAGCQSRGSDSFLLLISEVLLHC
jgi:hypothetical protein